MRLLHLSLIIGVLIASFVFVTGCTTTPLKDTPVATPMPTAPAPPNVSCGMENCHGLEIRCGANPVDFCTMVYTPGDRCRQYASCRIVQGSCQPVLEPAFEQCKNCVEMCANQYGSSPMGMATCEQKC